MGLPLEGTNDTLEHSYMYTIMHQNKVHVMYGKILRLGFSTLRNTTLIIKSTHTHTKSFVRNVIPEK